MSNAIAWACRRGMLELDLILIPFYEKQFQFLSIAEQEIFIQLLEYPDPEIFSWLMGYTQPSKKELIPIIDTIQSFMHHATGKL